MLAHILALAVAIGSILIYLAAFFFPEIHRKNDFIWSGVGLFYGLVLWVFARRITGGLLLGHVASVALLGWFGWQTMSLRRQVAPQAQQTPIPSSEEVQTAVEEQVTKISLGDRITGLASSVGGIFSGLKKKPKDVETQTSDSTTLDKAAIDGIATADDTTATEEVTATETIEQPTNVAATPEATATAVKTENESELTASAPLSPESEAAEQPETEEQTPPPTEEITPPTEPSTEEKPPSTPGES